MPALKHHIAPEPEIAAATPATSTPAPAEIVSMGAPIAYAESPARLLHERLSGHYETLDAPREERWSGAARVGFILGTSLGLWATIGGVTALLVA